MDLSSRSIRFYIACKRTRYICSKIFYKSKIILDIGFWYIEYFGNVRLHARKKHGASNKISFVLTPFTNDAKKKYKYRGEKTVLKHESQITLRIGIKRNAMHVRTRANCVNMFNIYAVQVLTPSDRSADVVQLYSWYYCIKIAENKTEFTQVKCFDEGLSTAMKISAVNVLVYIHK